ncbi:MAG: hypothetical protein B6D46_03450 [Polyangiaceae bacterium UTPRO1]|nr:sulfotransferase [Myxococcales bacterium]OQY68463.1 MAG: hypothetical protein B6D46_03450 [Polyangiaceae bacterium UTPRO1]
MTGRQPDKIAPRERRRLAAAPPTARPGAARLLRSILPANFEDVGGLFLRLLRSKDRAAYFAMAQTGIALVAAPLDRLLAHAERRLYARAAPPQKPILFIGGAPRSGTTIVDQILIRNLPVSYINNLTAVFPRAPVTANRIFGHLLRQPTGTLENFYGRTAGFANRNDGLHIWDRWLGSDRYHPPARLPDGVAEDMRRFFGAFEAVFGGPILNKNNALAVCADVVAAALPTARFVCIRRQPIFALQSILTAREFIQGRRQAPYGIGDPEYAGRSDVDPIEDVCAQLLYHDRRMAELQRELGADRFWIIEYEEFCRAPYAVVERVAEEMLHVPIDRGAVRAAAPPLRYRNAIKLSPAERARAEAALERLGARRERRDL